MATIVKPNTFVNGGSIIGSEWNGNFSTWIAEFNGNIDNDNIKAGANISGSKLRPYTIVNSKLAAGGTPCIKDIAFDYTSVMLNRYLAAGYRSTQGIEEFTYVAGVATGTITFATESNIQTPSALDPAPFNTGDPSFAAAPRVTLGIEHSTGGSMHHVKITAKVAASFNYEVRSSNGADVSTGKLHWRAVGLD